VFEEHRLRLSFESELSQHSACTMFEEHWLRLNNLMQASIVFGLHSVSRVQRNNILVKKPCKSPLKWVNCSKLP
jgi:hypothetical protein